VGERAETLPGGLDQGVLERVRARDPVAMNRFFDAYFDRVHAYVTRLVRDAVLAEDLTQDAFIRMHGAIDRLDPTRDPSPWVFTVVTNTVRDWWRSRHHRMGQRQVPLDEAWSIPEERDSRTPDRALERKEDAAMVRQAMGRLSPADREVLLLKDYQGLKTAEIEQILGLGADAVRQRHSRAVRRLGVTYRELRGIDGDERQTAR